MNFSFSRNNNTTQENETGNILVSCETSLRISLFLFLLFVSSCFFNGLNLWVYLKKKLFFTTINCFMSALIMCNLIGTLVTIPIVAHSAFICKFDYGRVGCIVSGFSMYFVGTMSIYLLVAISIERHLMLQRLSSNVVTATTPRRNYMIILICVLLSIFWCILPVFGWSYYSLEGAKLSCSVEWYSRSASVISYNMSIFLFVFMIPVIIIVFTNLKIVSELRDTRKELKNVLPTDQIKKNFKRQMQVTIVTIATIVCFLVSWTPYALVSIYMSLLSNREIDPLTATLPALFAKTSLVYPSVINVFMNKEMKRAICCCYGKKREIPTIRLWSAARTRWSRSSKDF